ncbi:Calsyntenin-2, partial [Lonchura striata]
TEPGQQPAPGPGMRRRRCCCWGPAALLLLPLGLGSLLAAKVNKHKPWIETSYHGIITENNDTVILDPPLVALDKDAPVPFAGLQGPGEMEQFLCVHRSCVNCAVLDEFLFTELPLQVGVAMAERV